MSLLTWLQTAELPDYEHRDTLVLFLRCHKLGYFDRILKQTLSEVLLYLTYTVCKVLSLNYGIFLAHRSNFNPPKKIKSR